MLGAGSSLEWRGPGRWAGHWELQPHMGLLAQRMFMKHLLGARLDQRLRTQVSNAGQVLKKLLHEGR